jgi:hypothetical protein
MMGQWTGEQRAFAIGTFYKKKDNYAATQQSFCQPFNINHNNPVPSANAIKTWVQNFEETGLALKKRSLQGKKEAFIRWKTLRLSQLLWNRVHDVLRGVMQLH